MKQPAAPREAQVRSVPRILRGALYAYLIVAGAAGVAALDGFSPLPTTALLDAWIVLFVASTLVRSKIEHFAAIALVAGYGIARVVPAILNASPAEDFLQAYRWLLYLVAFILAVSTQWGAIEPLRRVVLALVGMALLKAALSFAIAGSRERPGLLIENNFEIALFCGLILVLYHHLSSAQRGLALTMLAALMVLAGSRSGAVAFAVLIVYVLSQAKVSNATKVIAGAYALPLIAAVPIYVFVERARGATQIDRLNFLGVFLTETRNWDMLTWLFGTEPITPLSSSGCTRLSYYDSLFSTAGDGSCYSVILHAFVLRVVFDAGIFGLILAFLMPWRAMRWSAVPTLTALGLLGIAATNSLSVSGLNNPYVAFPILLAISLAGRDRAPEFTAIEPEPVAQRVPVRAGTSRFRSMSA